MTKFDADYLRFSNKQDPVFIKFLRILKNYELRYIFYLRKEEAVSSKIMQFFWHFLASNLIVIGNLGMIHKKENPSKYYL